MFTTRLASIISSIHPISNAQCESESNPTSYHPFIEPKLKSFIKPSSLSPSHYNFLHDSLPYRTSNNEQLRLYDQYMNDVLSFNNINKWKRITKCVQNDTENPSKQLICKALVTDYQIANEQLSTAQDTITKAYECIPIKYADISQHDREELYVRGFYEWIINFDQIKAMKIFRFISNKYPFDLYAAKRAQEMAFDLSDWSSMLAIFENIKAYHHVNGDQNPLQMNGNKVPSAYYNGLLSFAYEQMGYLDKAEQASMEGLEYYIDDVWLQHSLIHSRYFQKNSQNDLEKLIDFIIDNGSKYWDVYDKHAFITTHNWWHIGLLYLEMDNVDCAMDIFKKHIWRKGLDRRADQIGALSMFWILTMIIDTKEGEQREMYKNMKNEIGLLWQDAMDYVVETNKSVTVGYKLYDLLFMRGLIEMKRRYYTNDGGNDGKRYEQHKEYFDKKRKEMIEFCGGNDVLLKKYVGIVDAMDLMYGENVNDKSRQKAYEIMKGIILDLNVIGGSREQRFVFDQMYIDLLLKNNQIEELKQFLKDFLAKYPLKSLEIVAANLE